MKVLMVAPYIASVYGGPAKVIRELSQGLGQSGIGVDVITTNANGNDQLDVPVRQWLPEHGFRIQYFDCWHRNDLILSRSLIQWFMRHVTDYDVVHTHNIFSPLTSLVRWICAWKKVPYVVTPHGMLEPWALSYKANKKQWYYQWIEHPTLQQASTIHVLNQAEASHIHALGLSNTAILPNGVWREEFATLPDRTIFHSQYPDTQGKTLLLYLGRIDPKKGLDLLAPAFASVHQQFPETHLIVAGPDTIGFLPTVQGFFAEAGCLDAVTFTGMLTGPIKLAALSASSIYIAPSYSEGFSMSILEGMASGLPCIMTTGCNFPEASEAQAAYIVETNVESLTQALYDCLNNRQEARAMGDRARELVFQNYSWEQIAEHLSQIYQANLKPDKKVSFQPLNSIITH
jgi:glycosyltransferase involved in cell wall biosynthesis